MHSVLFNIFGFPIHSYGVMLAISFMVGIWLASYRATRVGLNRDVIPDVAFWLIISAIIGARLYYVLLKPDEFRGNLISIINPFQDGSVGIGGLVMYGGFIGAIVASFIFFKIKKLPFLPYADVLAPSLGIGIFFTRIGCFLNGCCFGAPSGTCAVSFPVDSPAGAYQASLHASGLLPSQLYESAGGLIIAAIILLVGRKSTFNGFQFYLTGLLYSVLRFGIDMTRFYPPSEKIGPLSHNQALCIFLFGLFLLIILFGKIRHNLQIKTIHNCQGRVNYLT
jgi:phosphatidylglycerol---prolipoprotein diacylglyceryl transferase